MRTMLPSAEGFSIFAKNRHTRPEDSRIRERNWEPVAVGIRSRERFALSTLGAIAVIRQTRDLIFMQDDLVVGLRMDATADGIWKSLADELPARIKSKHRHRLQTSVIGAGQPMCERPLHAFATFFSSQFTAFTRPIDSTEDENIIGTSSTRT